MPDTLANQDDSLKNSETYDDTKPIGVTLETTAVNAEDDYNGLRSKIAYHLDPVGRTIPWTGALPLTGLIPEERGFLQLGEDLEVVEKLVRAQYDAITDVVTFKGMLVYAKFNGRLGKALGVGVLPSRVAGMALTPAGIGFIAAVAIEGVIELSDWTLITGTTTLTPNAPYYLSTVLAGQMSTVVPTADFLVRLGSALTATKFRLAPSRGILRA